MKRFASAALVIGLLAIGVALGALVSLARPASAEVTLTDAIRILGDGVSVVCDAVPATIDDTDVANDVPFRIVVCVNDSALSVRIAGTPTAATPATHPGGEPWRAKLSANVVPKCYAAAPATIQCQEFH